MSEAKIEIKVGEVSFSGEGTEKWLSEQLEKLIEKIPQLSKVHTQKHGETGGSGTGTGTGAGAAGSQKLSGTLAGFLKEKKATANQVRKFLATAIWLHDHENRDPLSTADVTKALSDAKQKDLTNAANCLNQNVSKGFCQKKEGNQFFVTDEGRTAIG
jgi:hypothetical protein